MSGNGAGRSGGPLTARVTLQVPIEHGGEQLWELELYEPDVAGLMALDEAKGDWDQIIKTIMACTGLPPSVIRQLRFRDIKAVAEATSKMMGEADPEIGKKVARGLRSPSTGLRTQ